MKQISSVCMAAVRPTIWKLLLIIVLMAALELGLFWYQMPPEPVIPDSNVSVTVHSNGYEVSRSLGQRFDLVLDGAWFAWILRAALVALCAVQVQQGSEGKGKLTYTLRRLPMGERAVTTLWASVHMVSYWILWAAQLAVVLGCWKIYTVFYPTHSSALELFTKFYFSDFLHGLIPMQNYARVAANVLMFMALGLAAAYLGFRTRTGRKASLPVILIAVTMNFITASFQDDIADELMILIYVLSIGYMIWQIWVTDYEEA